MARPGISRDVEIGQSLGLTLSQFEALPREDLELLQAKWQADRDVCDQHGGPLSECDHPTWYPQRTVCLPAQVQAYVDAQYDALHEERPYHDGTFSKWHTDRGPMTPYHYRDGVRLWVSPDDINPDDDFLEGGD